jgi:uncharacterized protein
MSRARWPGLALILAAALGAAGALAPARCDGGGQALKAAKRAALTFPDGKTIQADLVDTPAERERGLMHRTKLPRDYGMLFAFPREMPMQFWMKNTLVPLDMLFIGSDKKINVIHKRVRASTTHTPDEDVARAGGVAQYVLELPAGAADRRKLAAGQTLRFDVAIPSR